ncbi:axonemal dynein light chain domain-containing protein 1 isoform X2 [Struthio camelus]|uniref:axonemal dynein light chain domain-containing protein 1 isoform X2 n=1 Tax=Struthio camelus TaxID=8801 RepID=UPI00360425EB
MSLIGAPVPGSKVDGRKMRDALCVVSGSKDRSEFPELRGTSRMLDHTRPVSSSLEYSFVPEEIFRTLTSAASSLYRPEHLRSPQTTRKAMGFKGCLQTPDGLWHYPNRRNKFRHLTDHPVSLTGAGRDVSYLCDVVAGQEDAKPRTPRSNFSERGQEQRRSGAAVSGLAQASLADSLIPEELHIVKNRGVLPLKYFDDKYTTLLEDSEKKLRLFPSMKPSGRLEVVQLMEAMDSMLEKAGVDNKLVGVTGPSQLHNVLELMKTEQNIYNIVFHELIRQVSVDCIERGQLLSKLRQRYVSLLERIPQQMKTLYKEMMAQRLVDRHIAEELFYFKESVAQLTRELYEVREHDRKVTREAEQAQQELATAVREAEMNANLVEEYRELYELQRARLEEQILLLRQERDIWSSAAHDLALKDTRDLADLQEETEQFRQMLGHIGAEIDCCEESGKEKLHAVRRGLTRWLQYFQDNIFSSPVKEELLDEMLQDIKNLENMLNEDLQQYEGEVYLTKMESLKNVARLQEHWTKLGHTVLNRHRDFNGALPPEHAAMEEINQRACELCQQYQIRISGDNGTTKILTRLVRSMEDWLVRVQKLKQGCDMHESELQAFRHPLPTWLAQVNALMSFIGSSQLHENENDKQPHLPVVPREVFKMIRQWILSMNSEIEKNITHLNHEVTELHRNLTLWLANLLRYMVPDRLCCECPQRTDTDMEEELRFLSACKLEDEAEGLVAKISRLSSYMISCCQEIVGAIVRKKQSETGLQDDAELQELNKIKIECCNWIQACSLILSEIKGAPVSFLSLEELKKLFGSEVLQLKLNLKDPVTSSSQEGLEAEDINSDKKPITEEETLEQQPGAGTDYLTEGDEATTDMIRYVGHDFNIHLKSLKSDIVSVTGREMTATKSSTSFSQKEFEALAMVEHLQVQLLETEIRAQNAEERSEGLEEKLEGALERIQELEKELEKEHKSVPEATPKQGKEKVFQERVSEALAHSTSPKASTSGRSKKPRKTKQ